MNENNLVQRLGYLSTGDGYRVCQPIDILAAVKDTTGLILTATTVPAVLATETNFFAISCVGGQTHVGLFNWVVPADYDEGKDELRIRLLCNRNADTAGDAAKTVTPLIYRKRAGVALSADLGCPTSPVIPALAVNLGTKGIEINCDAKVLATGAANRSLAATADASIKANDALTVRLTVSAAFTDDIDIYGIEMVYRSNLAFTDISDR